MAGFRGVHVFKPVAAGSKTLSATATTGSVAITGSPSEVRLSTETTDDDCFIEFGSSSVTAAVATGMHFRGGSTEIIRVPLNATHVAAICASTETATLYIQSGEGF